jgi:calcineurin-like phosphoesterase family protein
MSKIWITSDLHFGHDREFIWGPRGFKNVYEMNDAIIKNWNAVIAPEDDIYVLGDLMLGDSEAGIKMIKQLKGKIHIILGNHDTASRKTLYENCYNIIDMKHADVIKFKGYTFYLSHYPTITSNLEKEFGKHCILNLFGHTHQEENFYNGLPFCYHVGLDSHNCTPIDMETVLNDIKEEVKTCENYL